MAKRKSKNHENQIDIKLQLARALADYDNLIKRTEKEKSEIVRYANQSLAQELFNVVEILARVQTHHPDPGIELSILQLKAILESTGIVEVIPSPGDAFDPEKHEVVEKLEKHDQKGGTIAEVVNSGFSFIDGRLIRPAKVKVYEEKRGESQHV